MGQNIPNLLWRFGDEIGLLKKEEKQGDKQKRGSERRSEEIGMEGEIS